MLKPYKALFLDLSGVLYDGEQLIPRADEAVKLARKNKLVLRFVTNTATKNNQSIIAKLQHINIPIKESELFTAPIAAKRYIQQQQLRPYCLVHQAIKSDFADFDRDEPNCVLLGDAREDLHYQSLNKAFQLCKKGAPLIGIGLNKYFKDEHGLHLDAGAFIRAIEWAADTKAIIVGKPSSEFFEQIVASTPFDPDQCLMVGDDSVSDVAGAITAGLQGCLVRTGKYQQSDEQQLPIDAVVINSVIDLFYMSGARGRSRTGTEYSSEGF